MYDIISFETTVKIEWNNFCELQSNPLLISKIGVARMPMSKVQVVPQTDWCNVSPIAAILFGINGPAGRV